MAEPALVVVAAGSNIEPALNLPAALEALRRRVEVAAVSAIYETEPVGAPGSPAFWNAAVLVRSPISVSRLKSEVLRPIEADLGRVRGDDPNAPRPIDLDVVLSSEGALEDPASGLRLPDPELADHAYLAVPVSEVVPDWVDPQSGRALAELARPLAATVTRIETAGWQAMGGLDVEAIRRRLTEVRARTLELVGTLGTEALRRQHLSILSPMIWDLGHVANFEELWLVRELSDESPTDPSLDRMFDAVKNPRPTREALPLPTGNELLGYLARIREKTLEVAAGVAADGRTGASRLLRDGFVYEMVAVHEEQHQETLLQAIQVLENPAYAPRRRRRLPAPPDVVAPEMVTIPAGEFLMGAPDQGFAYDNERRRHPVELAAYRIDRFPVTNGDFERFVEDGGYRRTELWTGAGRAWLEETGSAAPANWLTGEGGWSVRFMDRVMPLPRSKPVTHVCYFEAETFARWAGKRLPTEAEWEKAALWDPGVGAPRRYPWGDRPPTRAEANLDQLAFEPADAGAYPLGASYYGVEQLVGDVWEWTASDFTAYPGFEAFPYREYSELFFGPEYKVLRGGSWATRPAVARGTFRNWDYPIRRQIFAGFRCAQDS